MVQIESGDPRLGRPTVRVAQSDLRASKNTLYAKSQQFTCVLQLMLSLIRCNAPPWKRCKGGHHGIGVREDVYLADHNCYAQPLTHVVGGTAECYAQPLTHVVGGAAQLQGRVVSRGKPPGSFISAIVKVVVQEPN